MSKFDQLTKYIQLLRFGDYGKMDGGKSSGGVLEFPHACYSETVKYFIHDIYDFCNNHPEYDSTNYSAILKEHGVENLAEVDVSSADARLVLAMFIFVLRSEHFGCEGALLSRLKDESAMIWLERLQELDVE